MLGLGSGSSCHLTLSKLEQYCLHTPAVQILFVLLLFAGYYLYCREIFAFLPQPFVPLWHQ